MRKPTIDASVEPSIALRVYMVAAGLNAKQLSERIGMKQATLSRKLAGKYDFKISEAKAIADALDLTAEEAYQIFLA